MHLVCFKGEKTTLQKHIRDEPTRHLSILCDGVVDLKLLMQSLQLNVERLSNRMEDVLLRTDCLEKLYGSQLLWKIDNYSQKFNEAKTGNKTTIFSPPFLTGRHGYKMALSACLFGDGKGKASRFITVLCVTVVDFQLGESTCQCSYAFVEESSMRYYNGRLPIKSLSH